MDHHHVSRTGVLWSLAKHWRHLNHTTLDIIDTLVRVEPQGAFDLLHLIELLLAVHDAGLSSRPLSSLVAEVCADSPPQSVVLHPRLTGLGSGSIGEMAALSVLAAAKRPTSVLEFGTHEGCSTWHLWANTRPQTRITTLDLPTGMTVSGSSDVGLHGVGSRPFFPKDPRVRLIETDTRHWTPDASFEADFCFIDAGHTYECVKNDTEKAMSVMVPGGLLIWHDAAWSRDSYGVNAYLRDLRLAGHQVHLVRTGPYDYSALAVLTVT